MSNDGDLFAELFDAVIAVAADAPDKQGQYVSHAKIYWPKIKRLRDSPRRLRSSKWRQS